MTTTMNGMDSLTTNPFDAQPEFPVVDLTDRNTDELALRLQNKQEAQDYHVAGETVFAFRRLHPVLERCADTIYDEGIQVEAMSHGMMVFEAINAAVSSAKPAMIGATTLSVVVAHPKTVKRIGDPAETQEVSEYFSEKLPNTAKVVIAASERFFSGHIHYALAGAALECLITSQALRLERDKNF